MKNAAPNPAAGAFAASFTNALSTPSGLSFDTNGNAFIANPGNYANPATLPLPQVATPADTVSVYNTTTKVNATLIQGARLNNSAKRGVRPGPQPPVRLQQDVE